VTDMTAGDPFLTHREAAERLHVSVRTVGRLMNKGALSFMRQCQQRKPYAGQVDYIASAIRAGRTGSIREIGAEWTAAQQKASAA